MTTPLSLRIARLLLAGAAAAAVMSSVYMISQSSEPLATLPWLGVFLVAGLGFGGAAVQLDSRPTRARWLAAGAALGLAGLGILAMFGAGNVTLPAAGLGVLSALATQLHPPSLPRVLAFAAYVAVGLLASMPMADAIVRSPWTLAWVVLWPWFGIARLGTGSFVALYGLIALGGAIVVLGFLLYRRPLAR